MFPPVTFPISSVYNICSYIIFQVTAIPKESAEDTSLMATNGQGEKKRVPVPRGTTIVVDIVGLHYNCMRNSVVDECLCLYSPQPGTGTIPKLSSQLASLEIGLMAHSYHLVVVRENLILHFCLYLLVRCTRLPGAKVSQSLPHLDACIFTCTGFPKQKVSPF